MAFNRAARYHAPDGLPICHGRTPEPWPVVLTKKFALLIDVHDVQCHPISLCIMNHGKRISRITPKEHRPISWEVCLLSLPCIAQRLVVPEHV